jgi:hypothetical protein
MGGFPVFYLKLEPLCKRVTVLRTTDHFESTILTPIKTP